MRLVGRVVGVIKGSPGPAVIMATLTLESGTERDHGPQTPRLDADHVAVPPGLLEGLRRLRPKTVRESAWSVLPGPWPKTAPNSLKCAMTRLVLLETSSQRIPLGVPKRNSRDDTESSPSCGRVGRAGRSPTASAATRHGVRVADPNLHSSLRAVFGYFECSSFDVVNPITVPGPRAAFAERIRLVQ
jgi:hypothetical protein